MIRFERWLIDLASLAASLVGLVTIGAFRPFWGVDTATWHLRRAMARRARERAK